MALSVSLPRSSVTYRGRVKVIEDIVGEARVDVAAALPGPGRVVEHSAVAERDESWKKGPSVERKNWNSQSAPRQGIQNAATAHTPSQATCSWERLLVPSPKSMASKGQHPECGILLFFSRRERSCPSSPSERVKLELDCLSVTVWSDFCKRSGRSCRGVFQSGLFVMCAVKMAIQSRSAGG